MKKLKIRLYKYSSEDPQVKLGLVDEDEWYWGDCWVDIKSITYVHQFYDQSDENVCAIGTGGDTLVVNMSPKDMLKLLGYSYD